jgi:hypothetical protein
VFKATGKSESRKGLKPLARVLTPEKLKKHVNIGTAKKKT